MGVRFKKIIMAAIMAVCFALVASEGFLGFEGSMEAGYADGAFGNLVLDTNYNGIDYLDFEASEMQYSETYYTELSGYVWLWGHLYAGGATTVQMASNRVLSGGKLISILPEFRPDFTNYKFETGLSFGPVTAFLSHDCTHPQQTGSWNYRVTSIWGEGSITRLGVRVRGESGKVGDR